MSVAASKSGLRTAFFDAIFQDNEGWACIAISDPAAPKSRFEQKFFQWPGEGIRMENYIQTVEKKYNVYYCVNLLEKPERKKRWCLPTDVLWADLDEVDPTTISPPAQIMVESSKGRWQALWLLSTKLDPLQAEDYSKRLAYHIGADKSGWDLTQLLRVPLTLNYKYNPPPEINLYHIGTETKAPPLLFEALPQVEDESTTADSPMPEKDDLPGLEGIMYKYTHKLDEVFMAIFSYEPEVDEDWSKSLWRLIHICFEAGMSENEAFVICNASACNKYRRDKRPITHLWKDVLKAQVAHQNVISIQHGFEPLKMPMIVDPDYQPQSDLFIDRYREWASEATDAVVEFHDLSASILLSTIVASSVRLETSNVPMVPNLWGMILGDSTLSRKTTAMRMVTDIIASIDPEIIVATDGSAEGLLTGLETRPHKTSLFYKDEVSGFFESINHRDYLSAMPEIMSALYDVPPLMNRRLRKETIRIESPVFIFFGGGVRDKVYEALTENYVTQGFLPRFLIASGDTDLNKLRRTGPPTEAGLSKRASIKTEVDDLYEAYATDVTQHIGGQAIQIPLRVNAILTNDAWERYGDIESMMVNAAYVSSIPNLALPTFERLSRSLLKLALVIGASRQTPKDQSIMIEERDVLTAAYYVQQWGVNSIEAILNAGKKVSEKLLDKLVRAIRENPGILRSTIMQHYHLSKREADDILGTLEDRGLVTKQKQGRGYAYRIA